MEADESLVLKLQNGVEHNDGDAHAYALNFALSDLGVWEIRTDPNSPIPKEPTVLLDPDKPWPARYSQKLFVRLAIQKIGTHDSM